MAEYDQSLVLPNDEHNQQLVANVHPGNWVNPEPAGRYNIVVIGAGTAGLITAVIAASLGAKVALIEKHLMGGDCLNVGCVPSKGMIRAARAWADLRNAAEFGLHVPAGVKYDFGAVMARMRKLRARISRNDSAHRYAKLGVDVYIGSGRFAGSDAIQVDGSAGNRTLTFAKAAICTGARAAAPPTPGLKEAGYFTNETVFSLTELPARIGVIGAGPIGCELAQSFARFGSQVYLVEAEHGIMPNEDRDAAAIVEQRMLRDGVKLLCCGKELKVQKTELGKRMTVDSHGRQFDVMVDEILVGVGRAPNVEGIGLDAVGVEYDKSGVKVNDRLQTTNPSIYAAGDICSRYKFTHAADAMAQIVIQNALFPHPLGLAYASVESLTMPWCTFTEPEIAHVGMYEKDAKAKGIEVETYTYKLDEVDRAILDGEDEGFARIHIRKDTDKIVGATIVASHAGDMISQFSVLMKAGAGAKALAATIHPYPTQAEVNKKVVNLWRKAHFSQRTKDILVKLFAWMRRG
ncbi:MAG: mercuric reductase [Nitrospiraceae bacterium]|jgi:pyruvate/2-oxoglutarate dehydrogenase complex dihydrolipoamide dehydrogenase (E3) component|uniref:mercuric reductase n=1 Tax=Nitrospira cf. moscoviensis SBR1015 TaxID=96242 RepID=UPI000A0A1C8E|nr:mercuric reductase [Nitrospira cf. moscoviensis SBR1015]MBY0248699.1 mercuric reductase [Nitrospiraceae bacterium]OQW36014.1 MAG: mercuric reductase [Nitrospira sp. SG-bin2]